MLFQSVDNKKFIGIYANGAIHRDAIPEGLRATWGYCSFLPENITYANLYCEGKSLDEVCPEELSLEWERASSGLRAQMAACREAKVDLHNNSFLALIPEKLLLEYGFDIRSPKFWQEGFDYIKEQVKTLSSLN